MRYKAGMTLMEIIVVLIIIGVAAAFCLPNFTIPAEHAKSSIAQNNLLAIYGAEQNYNNNFGGFCLATTAAQPGCVAVSGANCADSIAALNCNLSLSIQDDGSYTYTCPNAGGFTCTATRANGTITLTVTNGPVVLSGAGLNPSCAGPAGECP